MKAFYFGVCFLFALTTVAQTTLNFSIQPVTPGIIMAFNLSSCPSGWSELSEGTGRFMANLDPSDAAQYLGKASTGRNPTYSTLLDLIVTDGSTGDSADPGTGAKIGASGGGQGSATIFSDGNPSPISVTVSTTETNLPPYVLLKFCKKI